jgi:hypothetical protein
MDDLGWRNGRTKRMEPSIITLARGRKIQSLLA